MGLISCPECDAQISDKSSVCIHCGAPVTKKHKAKKPHVAQGTPAAQVAPVEPIPQAAAMPEKPLPSERSFEARFVFVCITIGALALLLYGAYALHSMPGTLSEVITQATGSIGTGIFMLLAGLIAIIFIGVTVAIMTNTGTGSSGTRSSGNNSSGNSQGAGYGQRRYQSRIRRTTVTNNYSTTYNNTYVSDDDSDDSYRTDTDSGNN